MANENRFKHADILTLSKRAANQCSNPSCGAITSGPSGDPSGSINIGEAAHIFGANPGSARFDLEMAPSERSSINNAIWLCGNCHKIVDDDPAKFPAGLLFEWQRDHERRIARELGKSSADIRRRYEDRHLEEFGRLSYLAERIILEKGDFWEYRLTVEVLRYEVEPIKQRWMALTNGLYVKPVVRIDEGTFFNWAQGKVNELSKIIGAFDGLTNRELVASWGPRGVPGNDMHIVTTCRLYRELCVSTLDWEESIRFSSVPEECVEMHNYLSGVGVTVFDNVAKILTFLNDVIEKKPESGSFKLQLEFSLPNNWSENVSNAMKNAVAALGR
ncbi:HNH endonuclease [Cellvibrio mixtus]|uniref:HNH endonuclease n=1 Tax=Cellvibrio mixtus TaxID=39650 RepID=A0A266Q820_9GAMM|nr:HNH endonuclease [Cellvibrio mixtus]OZY86033.1 HNH endonuclease [Cellvibrio mixtus]